MPDRNPTPETPVPDPHEHSPDLGSRSPIPAPGEPYVQGGVIESRPCGCTIDGRGTLPDPLRVLPCDAHLALPTPPHVKDELDEISQRMCERSTVHHFKTLDAVLAAGRVDREFMREPDPGQVLEWLERHLQNVPPSDGHTLDGAAWLSGALQHIRRIREELVQVRERAALDRSKARLSQNALEDLRALVRNAAEEELRHD